MYADQNSEPLGGIVPNPGTQEAIDAGCICPVMDNHYGRGYMGMEDVFIYTAGCPVHTPKEKKDETE